MRREKLAHIVREVSDELQFVEALEFLAVFDFRERQTKVRRTSQVVAHFPGEFVVDKLVGVLQERLKFTLR